MAYSSRFVLANSCRAQTSLFTALALSVVFAAPAVAGGQVWTVGPGGDFTDLATAVAQAGDGDVVVVESTPIQAIVIEGKGLTLTGPVVASGPVQPKMTSLEVFNLTLSQQLVVRGFTIVGSDEGLSVEQCHGAVRFEDCSVSKSTSIAHSRDVVFTRCTLIGTKGQDGWDVYPGPIWPTSGTTGLVVASSRVALFECSVYGGTGGTAFADKDGEYGMSGGGGGSGLGLEAGGQVSLIGGSVSGGHGGGPTCKYDQWTGQTTCGSPGVPGYGIDNPAGHVTVLDTIITSGGAGSVHPILGPIETVPGAARSLRVPSSSYAGGGAALVFEGEPGDVAVAFGGLVPSHIEFPTGLTGIVLLGLPMPLGPFVFGAVGAESDPVSLSFVVPNLPLLFDGVPIHFQAFAYDTLSGGLQVSSSSVMTVVKP